jgi:hypothetical protein
MYDQKFFESIRPGCERSARIVVPRIIEIIQPRNMIDIGCGEGLWAREFDNHGVLSYGIDGYEYGYPFAITRDRYRQADLSKPLPIDLLPAGHEFSLCLSLETAEHLPPDMADEFVAELCAFAPVVIFSAAIPGQGGEGHVNEQWHSYWVDQFSRQGFECFDYLRWEFWNNNDVDVWYRQNILMFVLGESFRGRAKITGIGASRFVGDVVHPEMLQAIRYDTYNRWRSTGIVPEVQP